MSDNWLIFIPANPTAQPSQFGADKAVQLLKNFAPNAGDEVHATFSDEVIFYDCGSNWSGVECPRCGKDVEEWWAGAMDSACRSKFEDLCVATPCCGHSTTLNDLNYLSSAGFARFALEGKNPNIRQTTVQQDKEISEALGLEIRKVWRRV
jgi:hypothetical protein